MRSGHLGPPALAAKQPGHPAVAPHRLMSDFCMYTLRLIVVSGIGATAGNGTPTGISISIDVGMSVPSLLGIGFAGVPRIALISLALNLSHAGFLCTVRAFTMP